MKNCREYEEWISAYLDGELSKPEREELMEHMTACRNCQQYFDDLVAIHEAAMEIEEVPVPDSFSEQVMDRVRATEQDKAETPKYIQFPQWRRWAGLAACCAFVLFGAWCFQNMRGAGLPAGQELIMADDMPQMTRTDDVPEAADGGENGIKFIMDEEQPMDNGLSRMMDSVTASEMYETEEEDAVEAEAVLKEYLRDSAQDIPAPSLSAPAGGAAGGTLTAGGEVVRQWVEDELGQVWESGQEYALTEEQYIRLVDFLTESGVEFRIEAGNAFWLATE